MKKSVILVLAVMVIASFAQQSVKSKQGNVDVFKSAGSGDVVCTADFNETLTLLKREGEWAQSSKVEIVARAAGNRSMNLDAVDVIGWLANPSAVFVLDQDASEFSGINIDRDFREYLKHIEDRERTEMRNREN